MISLSKKLTQNSKPEENKKLTHYNQSLTNYDVSFQFYEKGNHKKKLKDLSKEDLKELEKLILKIVKSEKEEDLRDISRGKTNDKKSSKKNLEIYGIAGIDDEIVHLGHTKSKFRLHGIFLGKSFKILCIDPDHKVHTT